MSNHFAVVRMKLFLYRDRGSKSFLAADGSKNAIYSCLTVQGAAFIVFSDCCIRTFQYENGRNERVFVVVL